MLVTLRLLKVSPRPVSGCETTLLLSRNATPPRAGANAALFLYAPQCSFPLPAPPGAAAVHRSSLTPSAGPVRRRGAHSLAPAFPTPGHCQVGLSHSTTQKHRACPGSLLLSWPLSAYHYPPRALKQAILGSVRSHLLGPAGAFTLGGSPTLGSLPTVPVCRRSPQPAAAAYARRRF